MQQLLSYKYYLLIFVLWIPYSLLAQRNAEKTYNDLGYKTAIPKFEADEKISLDKMRKIANSYRLNHDPQNAEMWYAEVVKNSEEAIDFLYYAQVLQSNENFSEAKKHYLKYDQMLGGDNQDKRGTLLAAAIDRMNEFTNTDLEIKNETILNTEKLDFSPSYYKNGLIFVSTRDAGSIVDDSKDIWINDNFMNLFHSDIEANGNLTPPSVYSLNLTSKFHEGPVSFNRSGDRIFFTRNDYIRGKRNNNSKGIMKLQIYTATRQGNDWSQPEELPFNTRENEEAHPSLTPDGKWLYFASDREGGFGGMDIYVSKFANGKWSEPINLGAEVNTAGNEVFPFAHDNGTIYFASNGWGGLGGLDIFATQMVDDKTWMEADNIGTPFNSPMDDFGLIMNVLGTEGYLTSAREGGFGQDDIYSFKRKPNTTIPSKICTYKMDDMQRISNVEVSIKEINSTTSSNNHTLKLVETAKKDEYILKFKADNPSDEKLLQATHRTDKNGEFQVELEVNKEYLFVAKKNGFLIAEETISTKGKSYINDGLDFCIPLEFNNCMVLEGLVKNKKYGNPIPYALVTIINSCTGESIAAQSDKNGAFSFPCMDCNCEFNLSAEKEHFSRAISAVSTIGHKCEQGGILTTLLELELVDPNAPPRPDVVMATGINPNTGIPNNTPNSYYNGQELKVGTVIELQNIFYDFDQYYIRDGDAKRDLDQVVLMMKQYPSMMIELSSHTDARGTDKYNKNLSKNRATAAVEYIIAQGIDGRRLNAKGYGEKYLRNNCANKVDCTEEEHQFNRRTEIKLTQFNEPNVNYKYIDNKPEKIDRANSKRKFVWE